MRIAIVAIAAAVGGLIAGTQTSAMGLPPSKAAVSGDRGIAAGSDAGRTVQLINGDMVRLRQQNGRITPQLVSADRHGIGSELRTTTIGDHIYAVPGAAQPYVNRSLDISLFDINALARVEQAGRLPLRITYSGAARPAVPGLTVTAHNGAQETGYLTANSARTFGRALVSQWNSDSQPRHRAETNLFGGIGDITLDAPTTPVAQPHFPQVTVIIKVLDRNGKPAPDGDVVLTNIDDVRRYSADIPVVGGEARASVPLGNYSLVSALHDVDPATKAVRVFELNVSDYQVTGDRQTVTLDARRAVRLSISTPRPATTTMLQTAWGQLDGTGALIGMDSDFEQGEQVYATPTSTPTVGKLRWMTIWHLEETPAHGLPYSYDATYEQVGRATANQHYRVTNARTATVDSRYYTDGPAWANAFSRAPYFTFPYFYFADLLDVGAPLHRIEYVSGPTDVTWKSIMLINTTDSNPFGVEYDDGMRWLRAGAAYRADWLRGPIAPGVPGPGTADTDRTCGACRTGKALSVQLAPATDSDPAHSGDVSIPSSGHASHFRLYRDGTLIHDEYDSPGGTFAVPTGAATYRIIDHVLRGQDNFLGSTSNTVDVTFRSAAGSGAKPPAGWKCDGSGTCTVLPILQAKIPLPTDLTGHLPVGTSVTTLTVGHVPGAAASAIRSVELQTSFDGGKTWRDARTVRAGAGKFLALLENPAAQAGHRATLRLVATDVAGGKLVETVSNAYSVSSSASRSQRSMTS